MNTSLIASATRILLTVFSATVILAACGDPALADEAYAVLDTLTTQYSPRESGTDQETAAVLHLQGRLNTIGYDTSRQGFGIGYTLNYSYIFYTDAHLESDEGESLLEPIRPHLRPGPPVSLLRGFVTGPLTPVGDTSQVNILSRGLEGRIALIEHGAITSDELIPRVMRAGAVGAIIISNAEDSAVEDMMTFIVPAEDAFLFRTSPSPWTITVVSVSMAKGNALLELIERGDVTASINVDVEQGPVWSVVARKPGTEDSGRSVILGAHYDTVKDTQGASDNGSGLATLLTIASHIAERDYPFDIGIVLFGAEEQGLLGSEHYVENMSPQEIDGAIAMLNFDALGSGTSLTVSGDFDLTSEAVKIGRELGASITLEAGGLASSDHAPFEEAGIPTLFLSSNDLSRINSPQDTIEHINPDLLGYGAEIVIAMLDSLAMELEE